MAATQVAPMSKQPDVDLLELIRKQLFGSGISSSSFDFNSIFSPNPVSGSGIEDLAGAIGAPNDAIGNANPAIGSAVANLGMSAALGLVGVPGLSTVVGQVTGNSTLANLATIAAALGINSIDSVPNADAIAASTVDSDPGVNGTVGDTEGGISGANPGETGDAPGGIGSADSSSGDSYHNGGFVAGPRNGDKVNIQAEGGEFVVPNRIVDMLGRNFFEKILLTESPLLQAAEKEAKASQSGAK